MQGSLLVCFFFFSPLSHPQPRFSALIIAVILCTGNPIPICILTQYWYYFVCIFKKYAEVVFSYSPHSCPLKRMRFWDGSKLMWVNMDQSISFTCWIVLIISYNIFFTCFPINKFLGIPKPYYQWFSKDIVTRVSVGAWARVSLGSASRRARL